MTQKPQSLVILGSGQLGQMLAQAAEALGVPSRFATLESLEVREATPPETLLIESEFAPLPPAETPLALRLVPSLQTLLRLRSKLEQKKTLTHLKIPTAAFEQCVSTSDSERAHDQLTKLGARFQTGFVLKRALGGYDGKGNYPVSPKLALNDPKSPALQAALSFMMESTCYAEERISFVRELALVATRGRSGEMVFYPLVISEQTQSRLASGICFRVKGPACSLGVDPKLETKAQEIARAIAEETALVGTFAVEFFETPSGLLVNEIAPRVHNTAHFSLTACSVSQFENHIRAALGLEIMLPKTTPYFVMQNILGPETGTYPLVANETAAPKAPNPPFGALHWYHKTLSTPGRKLGHFSAGLTGVHEIDAAFAHYDARVSAWHATLLSRSP